MCLPWNVRPITGHALDYLAPRFATRLSCQARGRWCRYVCVGRSRSARSRYQLSGPNWAGGRFAVIQCVRLRSVSPSYQGSAFPATFSVPFFRPCAVFLPPFSNVFPVFFAAPSDA